MYGSTPTGQYSKARFFSEPGIYVSSGASRTNEYDSGVLFAGVKHIWSRVVYGVQRQWFKGKAEREWIIKIISA